MKNRGFTLIEVMVVLSILAIIAILAYNFFGSTMKEARNKQMAMEIVKGLQHLSDATEKYVIDNGEDPPTANLASDGTLYDGWVMDYLKAEIHAPAASFQNGCITTHEYHLCINCYNLSDSISATNDTYVQLNCVTDDVCKEINNIYSGGIGYAIHDALNNTTYPLPEETTYCTKIVDNRNTAVMIIKNN